MASYGSLRSAVLRVRGYLASTRRAGWFADRVACGVINRTPTPERIRTIPSPEGVGIAQVLLVRN